MGMEMEGVGGNGMAVEGEHAMCLDEGEGNCVVRSSVFFADVSPCFHLVSPAFSGAIVAKY